jgi:hypothetical protein
MVNLFFSYSHKDESLRDELETHLALVKREGTISTWHDRRIGAGEEIEDSISKELEEAQIILLLVTPDFLASDYCFEKEMHRAMARHEEGSARVIPVILRPCDWHTAPFGKLKAVPTDAKPITKYPNQDEAFLEVVRAIREAATGFNAPDSGLNGTPSSKAPEEVIPTTKEARPRSSNLRIPKEFSDREFDRFLEESFNYIAEFFENSLEELEARNDQIETRFRRISENRFSASIYSRGRAEARCTIWLAGRDSFAGGIAYVQGETDDSNSLNSALGVEDDGYTLFLSPRMDMRGENGQKITMQGGAEYFWEKLVEGVR